ncbi:MAG TPA: type II secretion system protein M [Pseudomonadaceae bacterium]|nr:type II secretion system protein M [Pseudomonadaceae bacterium]
MKTLLNRFGQQSRRDQAALAVLALAFLGFALAQLVIRPLQASVQAAESRLQAAEQSLASVQSLATRLESLQQTAPAPAGADNVARRVDASAAVFGVQILSMEPAADGKAVAIRLEGLPLAALMQWLQQLDSAGIGVESLVVLPARNGSLVNSTIRLVNQA